MNYMRRLWILVWAAAAAVVAGCGGSALTSPAGGGGAGGGATVAKVNVTASPTTIAVDGSTTSNITATALDANNAGVSGATVTFASSTGGAIAIVSATTDTNGNATATLSNLTGTAGAAAGTNLTVSATAGGVTGTATVGVVAIQESISIITSLPSIPSDGSKSATITALVRNAQNQFVTGVPVTFTATSGGLTVTQGTTGANGSATATLNAAGDPTNRTITVTATAAATSATLTVPVAGTTLTVSGPTTLVQNSVGTYTVALADAGGNGIPNATVTLTSAKGNTLSAATLTTDATGHKTFTMTAINSGTDTLTATFAGEAAGDPAQSTAVSVAISSQNFAFSAPAANTQVNLGTAATLTVAWTSAGVPQAGQTVAFSATRGTLSSATATTDGTGTASVTISSTTAGPAVISATGNGVTAQLTLDFIATDPSAIEVQASPATIAAQGQSTITATVRDSNNNLVEGQVVDFAITKDSTGGSLSLASATTNAQGLAQTVYTASTSTSASNGIVISATVQGTAVTGSTTLTVAGATVFLSLGTGNLITPFSNTQYSLPYTVQAIDSAGNGVNNVTITFTVTSLGYVKGYRMWNGTQWATITNTKATDPYDYSLPGIYLSTGCRSEDVNGNGILDPGEDYNNNGKLDPGLVVSTDVGSAVTANGGSAAVNLIYPRDHAYYVAVRLTATATVNGTQASTTTDFWLPGLAADFNTQTVAPPGPLSPYGTATTCANPL
jgi:hypothetical protein